MRLSIEPMTAPLQVSRQSMNVNDTSTNDGERIALLIFYPSQLDSVLSKNKEKKACLLKCQSYQESTIDPVFSNAT